MNEMLKRGGASGNLLVESKFETPETVFFGENAFSRQFGAKLRRVYELPPVQSEPDGIRALMRELELRLEGKR
jgi:hypothetical protein